MIGLCKLALLGESLYRATNAIARSFSMGCREEVPFGWHAKIFIVMAQINKILSIFVTIKSQLLASCLSLLNLKSKVSTSTMRPSMSMKLKLTFLSLDLNPLGQLLEHIDFIAFNRYRQGCSESATFLPLLQ